MHNELPSKGNQPKDFKNALKYINKTTKETISEDEVRDASSSVFSDLDEFDAVAYINEPRWRAMSLGLDRIYELLDRLGNPHESLKFVHVAGTNGKGSTCAFMASILQKAGYKVGLFTSPYIEFFEERIRINGKPISSSDLCAVTLQVREAAEAMEEHPTEFELMTAVAFLYFAQNACDIVVAEVGLGGRLDSTNVIKTVEVALLAPISYDHCALLGNTLTEIAGEKAGIIKPAISVVSAVQDYEAAQVIKAVAAENKASLSFVDETQIQGTPDSFSYKGVENIHLSMAATYQCSNAALAIEGCKALRRKGWKISDEAIHAGLKSAQWAGRFEVVHTKPDIVIDGAHNIHAARQLVKELDNRYPLRRILFCMGVMADKDHKAMLELYAPIAKAFVCYAPLLDRALSAHKLAVEAMQALACMSEEDHGQGCLVQVAISPADAVHRVLSLATEYDVICFCGSLYGIADVKEALKQEISA